MLQKVLVGGVVALALALAGCGSSESKPLTKAEFAQQANAICMKRKAAYAAAIASNQNDIKAAIKDAVPALKTSVDKLAALRPPANLQSAYTEIMAVERREVRLAQATLAGNPPRGEHEIGPPLHRHERLRVQLGMPACN